MQEEAPQSLSDRIVNVLEQLLQQLSDSSADSDNDDDDTQGSVAELIVDVHVLDNRNYSEDAEVRIHEAELLPQLVPEKTHFRRCRRRRRAENRNVEAHDALFQKKRSSSDEVLCRFRSRSPLRVRKRTPP